VGKWSLYSIYSIFTVLCVFYCRFIVAISVIDRAVNRSFFWYIRYFWRLSGHGDGRHVMQAVNSTAGRNGGGPVSFVQSRIVIRISSSCAPRVIYEHFENCDKIKCPHKFVAALQQWRRRDGAWQILWPGPRGKCRRRGTTVSGAADRDRSQWTPALVTVSSSTSHRGNCTVSCR